ncbi:MAG: hypothetical protein ABI408_07750 [Gemmatimonadaceae bacterium]
MRTAKKPMRVMFMCVTLATAACGGSGIDAPGGPQDRGTLLLPNTSADFVSQDPIWTKDGAEIVFVDATGLKAVNVASGLVRVLDPTDNIEGAARARSGEWIYFAAPVPNAAPGAPNIRLNRVHPATLGVETVGLVSQGWSFNVVVSDDERWIAYGSVLFDTQTGVSRVLPDGIPGGFSPDGTRLMYWLSSKSSYAVISTADGSSQPVMYDGLRTTFRWKDNSPQLLFVEPPTSPTSGIGTVVYERDGLTGAKRDIAQFDSNPYSFGAFLAGWSEDGQTLGVWLTSSSPRTELAVIRAGAATAIVLRFDGDAGKLVFSPTATAVAYPYFPSLVSSDQSLYVKTGI